MEERREDDASRFDNLLTTLVKRLCPNHPSDWKAEPSDLSYRIVSAFLTPRAARMLSTLYYYTVLYPSLILLYQIRQAVYNWRRTFFNKALAIVKAKADAIRQSNRHNATQAIAAWAKAALEDGGEAHWENPVSHNVRSILASQTSYIITDSIAPERHCFWSVVVRVCPQNVCRSLSQDRGIDLSDQLASWGAHVNVCGGMFYSV